MESALREPDLIGGDADLHERFRNGDDSAFEEVVLRHRADVYRMARRILPRHEDADEAAQQAFVRAWRARRGFRGEASLRTWLIRIALNVAKSMLASRRELAGLELLERAPDASAGSEERILLDERSRRVRRAVQRLPERQRMVVLLKVFGDLTHREVATLLELTDGAVKAHLHQAVSNLRKQMAAEARGER